MTPKEKNQLLELRRNGWSIKRLAELVRKSIPMIKKILYSVRPDEIYCIECGKPTKRRNVTSKFCSKECKRKYYKKHPDYLKKKTIHTGICPCCHKEFTWIRSRKKWRRSSRRSSPNSPTTCSRPRNRSSSATSSRSCTRLPT